MSDSIRGLPTTTRRLPTMAVALGLAGLIPFLAFGWWASSGIDDDRVARATSGLVSYGAVILAFLGGVQWGFVLGEPPVAFGPRRTRYRLVFGIAPSLVGWAALLVLLALGWPRIALAILLAGFIAETAVETELAMRGLMPRGYLWLRWGLSAVVILVLGAVLVLRLLGTRLGS